MKRNERKGDKGEIGMCHWDSSWVYTMLYCVVLFCTPLELEKHRSSRQECDCHVISYTGPRLLLTDQPNSFHPLVPPSSPLSPSIRIPYGIIYSAFHSFLTSLTMPRAIHSAIPIVVTMGLTPLAEGNTLASATYTPLVPQTLPL